VDTFEVMGVPHILAARIFNLFFEREPVPLPSIRFMIEMGGMKLNYLDLEIFIQGIH